jgi:hypothetical protein
MMAEEVEHQGRKGGQQRQRVRRHQSGRHVAQIAGKLVQIGELLVLRIPCIGAEK